MQHIRDRPRRWSFGEVVVSNITSPKTSVSLPVANRIRQSLLPLAPFFVRSSSPGLKTVPLPPSGCNNSTFPRPDDVSPRQIKHAATRPNKSTFRPCSSIRTRSMTKYRTKLETSKTGSSRWLIMWDIASCPSFINLLYF